MPECVRNSFWIIGKYYSPFIVFVPIAFVFMGPASGSFFCIGFFIWSTLFAVVCSLRERRESQNENISTNMVAPAPSEARVSRRLAPTVISDLSTFVYTKEQGEENSECAICLGGLEQGETVKRLPICTHLFHKECIDMWLGSHMTCPVCRVRVDLEAAREVAINIA